MASNDALSCPQACRLVPPLPPHPLSSHQPPGSQPAASSTLANRITPLLSNPLASQASLSATATSSQLLSPGQTSSCASSPNIRDRTNSLKRKAIDNLTLASAKAIRLTESLPALVSQLSDNKLLADKIGVEVSDEKFMDNNDSDIVSILSKFSLAISGQHKLISNVVSELESVKLVISDIQASICANPPAFDNASFPPLTQQKNPPPGVSNPNGLSALNKRRTLKQAPIGSEFGFDVPWNQVNNRKIKKTRPVVIQCEDDSEAELPANVQKSDPFSAAVKDAEKSILIHNLNLGQQPTLNPSTISSKITAALLLCVAQFEPLACGQVTSGVKDIVDDITGLVKDMTLFGTGTRLNRNPQKPEEDGNFYTVPVKFSFASKQVASSVTEALKGKYKLRITTPYHKSLRECFSFVQKKVRSHNPGYQVRVNLDMKNRALKASVRPSESATWELLGETFSLPKDALDPKFKDVKSMVFPSSPVIKTPPKRFSSSEKMDYGTEPLPKDKLAKTPETVANTSRENSAALVTKNSGVPTQNRFSALARTPPPGHKSTDGAAG